MIIFDDADIALAAETIAVGGYFNAGQDCTAATRVIASPKVYADIVDALAEQAKDTKTGAARRRGHPLRAAQQPEPVRARRGHGRRGARPRAHRGGRRTHRRARASSTSRP